MELLNKMILERFDEEEQKLFVQSFKAYLEYGTDETKFVISLDDVWQWLGFSRIDPCKRLLVNNFEENIHYITHNHVEQNTPQKRGGHNRRNVLMNVNTFKKLCMKACTKRSDAIHDYYIKLENMYFECLKIQYETRECELKNALQEERHMAMVQAHEHERLVYILKVQTLNDKFIIKIGKTYNLRDRLEKIRSEFKGNVSVLDIFSCDNADLFERFVHAHPMLQSYKYTQPINGIKKSTECYIVDEKEYKKITNFMNMHVGNYKHRTIDARFAELEQRRLDIVEIIAKNPSPYSVELVSAIHSNYIAQLDILLQNCHITYHVPTPDNQKEQDDIHSQSDISNVKPSTRIQQGPHVQMYHKDDLTQVVRVYNTITDAIRQEQDINMTQLKHAVNTKTVYKNHRWYFVQRGDDPNKVYDIGATINKHSRNHGNYVCMMNKEQNVIERVFCLQREAAKYVKQNDSAMCNAVRYNRMLSGKYWRLWNDVPNDIQESYLLENTLPEKYKNIRGVKVSKIDPSTHVVIKTYNSFGDVVKEHQISPKTIKNVSKHGWIHAGFIWKLESATTHT